MGNIRCRPDGAGSLVFGLTLMSLLVACGSDPRSHPAGGTEPPAPDLDFPSCRQGDPIFEVGALDAAFPEPVAQPALLDGDILLHRRQTAYANSPSDLEVFRIDPRTGSSAQLTANDGDDIVQSANDGALLLLQPDHQEYAYRLVYRRDGQETDLLSGLPYRPYHYLEADVRLVNREAAVLLEGDVVYLYAEGELHAVSGGLIGNMLPDLEGTTAVWAASDGGPREIYVGTPGGRERLTEDEIQDRRPLLSGSRVFWLADQVAMMLDRSTGERTVLDPGPCFHLSADSGQAVFLCRDIAEGDTHDGYPFGTRLVLFDGRSTRTVVSHREDIMAVQLDGGRIAWIEYPREIDNAWPNLGAVFYLPDPVDDDELYEVASVGSGCWYCDMYWPPPSLDMSEDLLVWSYGLYPGAEHAETDWWFPPGIGYAVITTPLTCGASP